MASLCYIKWPHHHFFNESPVFKHFCCHGVFLAFLVGQLLKSLLGTLSPPSHYFQHGLGEICGQSILSSRVTQRYESLICRFGFPG